MIALSSRRRPEADSRFLVERAISSQPLPAWPFVALVTWYPVWFLTGFAGFAWVAFCIPMLFSLMRRSPPLVPRYSWLWLIFLAAVIGSVFSIDGVPRLSGWVLRSMYYFFVAVFCVYLLNGGNTLTTAKIIRSFTWLWIFTIAGGYLAFVLAGVSYRSPLGYLMPAPLLENDLIFTMVTPSFADVQDIVGFPVPRPKAPFPYTNSWGSMTALLTPFSLMALRDTRVGFSPRLLRVLLAASVVPIVISLNRGLWLSLGLGLIYAAIRFGLGGEGRMLKGLLWGALILAAVLVFTPLGDLIAERLDNGHSDKDRFELATDAISGTLERPVLGWGAPRPNDRNLPSVGTHGQLWFIMFSHGFVGVFGYVGFLVAQFFQTIRQRSATGMWAHIVILIGMSQMLYYLQVPHQMFTIMAAIVLAIRLQWDEPDAPRWA